MKFSILVIIGLVALIYFSTVHVHIHSEEEAANLRGAVLVISVFLGGIIGIIIRAIFWVTVYLGIFRWARKQ